MRPTPLSQASDSYLRIDLGEDGAGTDSVEIALRRSRKAKRANLRVRPGRLPELVLPVGAHTSEAQRLLERHRGWLQKKLQWAAGVEAQARQLGLLEPGLVWLNGRALSFAQALPASLAAAAGTGSDSGDLTPRVERWYRTQARTILQQATADLAAELVVAGLLRREPGRVSIRDPRSRWGSCSARGDISYSWRLVMMPRPALEYVVCHELCHLEVHNHSQHFWRLLERARPGWRAEAGWLRRYGPMISLHRPTAPAVPGSESLQQARSGELPGIG